MKIMGSFCILAALCIIGCAPHTDEEKFWFGTMVAGQFADYYTTERVLDQGGSELNPILGDHPSDSSILLFKAGAVGLFYGLGQVFPDHRKGIYKFGTLIGFGAAGWNCTQLE